MTRITGPILALDLSSKAGYCIGLPGQRLPRSGSVVLKEPGEHRRVAMFNLYHWLTNELETNGNPALIVTEAPISLAVLRWQPDNARLTYALHGIVEMVTDRFRIRLPCEANMDKTRKHFIGMPRCGTREETKAAVIRRAQALGYIPKNCFDDDRSDAVSIWDYACAHFAGRVPDELVLFESGRASKARRARAS